MSKEKGEKNGNEFNQFTASKENLLGWLEFETKVFKNENGIKSAFKKIDRADFVGPDYKVEAYEDYPLPIGFNQTISQPTTVAFMLELLDAREGQNILDVGSGSGWTTALLAEIVGQKGRVTGVEIIPELVGYGKNNLDKYNFKNTKIFPAEKEPGYPKNAPYDRILVSASANKLPYSLESQLKENGIMVIPIGDAIVKIEKSKNGKISKKEFPGFVFVPLK